MAGVAGNGQRELGDVILGLQPCIGGAKYLDGQLATHWSVARIRAGGVVFIPEDALGMAAVAPLTVLDNMILGDIDKYGGEVDSPWTGTGRATISSARSGAWA